jgi:PKHD-type hydroxylase
LVVQDTYGTQSIKFQAGDLVLYPGTSVHQVKPVTRGYRLACFFWVESLVRSDDQRRLLYELDMNLLRLRQAHGETAETTALTGTYHNLLRMWVDT